jgi:hypothetical protein
MRSTLADYARVAGLGARQLGVEPPNHLQVHEMCDVRRARRTAEEMQQRSDLGSVLINVLTVVQTDVVLVEEDRLDLQEQLRIRVTAFLIVGQYTFPRPSRSPPCTLRADGQARSGHHVHRLRP